MAMAQAVYVLANVCITGDDTKAQMSKIMLTLPPILKVLSLLPPQQVALPKKRRIFNKSLAVCIFQRRMLWVGRELLAIVARERCPLRAH